MEHGSRGVTVCQEGVEITETHRERLLEQQVLGLQLELVAVKASTQREIDALRAQNAAMLGCGRLLEAFNENLQARLTTAEVGLTKTSAINSSMAAEGRALEVRLAEASTINSSMVAEGRALEVRLAEAQEIARQKDLQLSTAMAMTRAEVDVAIFPLAQWVAALCHDVQEDLDLNELGKQLAMRGQDTAALKILVNKVKTKVMTKVRATPMSTRDMFRYLGNLPPAPTIPVPSLPGNPLLAATAAAPALPAVTHAPAAMPALPALTHAPAVPAAMPPLAVPAVPAMFSAPAVISAPALPAVTHAPAAMLAVPAVFSAPALPAAMPPLAVPAVISAPAAPATGPTYQAAQTSHNAQGRVLPGKTRRRTSY